MFLQVLHKYNGGDWRGEEASEGEGQLGDTVQHDGNHAPIEVEATRDGL